MSARAAGKFEVRSWNEAAYAELSDGRKLTRASVTQGFTGDIEGEGSVEWLMFYRPDGTATFLGFQRVEGRIGGKTGSFVLETAGTYDGKEARATWSVVSGSATGELRGLRGTGTYVAGHGSTADVTLEYELE